MKASTRVDETELKKILEANFAQRGATVTSIRVGREDYGGDPRETSYGYVEVNFEFALKP
jgi:hypothetical protein